MTKVQAYKCVKCSKVFTSLTEVCCGQKLCRVFATKKQRKTVTARPKASFGLTMAQIWAESSVSEYSNV